MKELRQEENTFVTLRKRKKTCTPVLTFFFRPPYTFISVYMKAIKQNTRQSLTNIHKSETRMHQRTNAQTHKRTNAQTHKRTNAQTQQRTNEQRLYTNKGIVRISRHNCTVVRGHGYTAVIPFKSNGGGHFESLVTGFSRTRNLAPPRSSLSLNLLFKLLAHRIVRWIIKKCT